MMQRLASADAINQHAACGMRDKWAARQYQGMRE